MVPYNPDHTKRLIPLTLITLSSFHCILFIILISVCVKNVTVYPFFITTGNVMLLQNFNLRNLQLKNIFQILSLLVVCVNARFFFPYFPIRENRQALTIYPVTPNSSGKLVNLTLIAILKFRKMIV
jgi:hypothetical protein